MNCQKPKCYSASRMQRQLLQGGEGTVHCSLLLATAGRSCKGHCNVLVPAGTVYFLFISEAEKSHQAVRHLQFGNSAADHQN